MNYRHLLASSAIALLLQTPALAQEAPAQSESESDDGIQDIVVTAQRREENAQRTALSIEVFGGDDLRSQGVTSADSITKLAPGVQVAGGTTTQVYVRGVGDFGVTATANPAVVTNIDGVTVSRPQAISGNFFDLERLELLKGPQGTLYGRNASGGALNILTAAPKFGETGGYLEATVGNYNQYGGEGALNLAAGENAAFRLSFQINDRDGYLSAGGDDDKHQSVRLQARVEAGDLTLRPILSYTHLGGKGTGIAVLPKLPGRSAWLENTDPVAGAAYLNLAGAIFNGALLGGCNPAPGGNCPPPPALLADPSTSVLFQDVTSYSASLLLDYKMDFATLTVIPGYRRTNARFAIQPSFLYNVGGVYTANGDRSDGETSDQYSLEVRLSNETDKLKWVIGGYWFKENQSTEYALQGGLILNSLVSSQLRTDALAAFAQATYSLSDRFRLTGGIRYTQDKRAALDLQKFAISPAVTTPAAVTGLPPIPCLPEHTDGRRAPAGDAVPADQPDAGFL